MHEAAQNLLLLLPAEQRSPPPLLPLLRRRPAPAAVVAAEAAVENPGAYVAGPLFLDGVFWSDPAASSLSDSSSDDSTRPGMASSSDMTLNPSWASSSDDSTRSGMMSSGSTAMAPPSLWRSCPPGSKNKSGS